MVRQSFRSGSGAAIGPSLARALCMGRGCVVAFLARQSCCALLECSFAEQSVAPMAPGKRSRLQQFARACDNMWDFMLSPPLWAWWPTYAGQSREMSLQQYFSLGTAAFSASVVTRQIPTSRSAVRFLQFACVLRVTMLPQSDRRTLEVRGVAVQKTQLSSAPGPIIFVQPPV